MPFFGDLSGGKIKLMVLQESEEAGHLIQQIQLINTTSSLPVVCAVVRINLDKLPKSEYPGLLNESSDINLHVPDSIFTSNHITIASQCATYVQLPEMQSQLQVSSGIVVKRQFNLCCDEAVIGELIEFCNEQSLSRLRHTLPDATPVKLADFGKLKAAPDWLVSLFNLWQSESVINNELCDEWQSITYEEAINRVLDYRTWLQEAQLNQPVAFYVEQSIDHVLMLIALMANQTNCVPLPPQQSELGERLFADQLSISSNEGQLNKVSVLERVALVRQANPKTRVVAGSVYFKTSGSLGDPKWVVYRAEQAIANSNNVLNGLPLTADSRVLIPVALHHKYGFGAALFPALLSGASIMVANSVNVLKMRDIEKRFQPNAAYLTPATIKALMVRPSKYNGFEMVVSAGDCFDTSLLIRAQEKFSKVFNLYGSTELGVIAIDEITHAENSQTAPPQTENTVNDFVKALPGVNLQIEDSRITVDHPYGFDYYLHEGKREANYATGDLAEVNAQGKFRVIGRADLSINREGRLIAFAELETQIKRHPAVGDVALLKGPKDHKGHTIVAVVEPTKSVTAEVLREELTRSLPRYAAPSDLFLADPLPRLPNGKLNRRLIAENYKEATHE